MKNKLISVLLGLTIALSSSCLKQGKTPKIPGVDGPKINVKNGKLMVSLGLENLQLPIGLSLPLSGKLKNSRIAIAPSLEGGTIFQAEVELGKINTDFFEVVPSNVLPNGDSFPFLTEGELPARAFYIEKAFKSTFYVSKKVFGFFIPLKFGENVTFSVPYRLKIGGKQVGIISAIGNNAAGEGSGIVVLLNLKDIKNNKDIQTALKYSKKRKYKNKVF